MDHHTLAAVSITGTCLDVIGSLYLAYDLLGGQHGPLRLLTRAVTYSLVFGVSYATSRRPHLSRRQFWGTVTRTVGYIVSALVCSAFIHHVDHAWSLAIRVGLVTGIVTAVGVTFNPYIEYYADSLPERRLGAFGIGLILCGFAMQSLQYWLALFDVRLT
jgi:hypothetical protein